MDTLSRVCTANFAHSFPSLRKGKVARLLPAFLLPLLFSLLLPLAVEAKKKPKPEDLLSEKYQSWLLDVELLISKEERALFLELEKDYQRDAFIERFWKVRDKISRTARNEFREEWEERLRAAREEFDGVTDDRSQILLTNGPPSDRYVVESCPLVWPMEAWRYVGSDKVGYEFYLLFYQRWGKGKFRLWEPFDGIDALFNNSTAQTGNRVSLQAISDRCVKDGDVIVDVIAWLFAQGGEFGVTTLLSRLRAKPEPPGKEWVATFSSYSTDLPEGAATFEAEVAVDYPGRYQSRTVVQGSVQVGVEGLGFSELAGHSAYNLMLNGEILRGEELFENFRYKFDLPTSEVQGEKIPLVFQRYLRPGSYRLIVSVEDVNTGSLHRTELPMEVPKLEGKPPPVPTDPETARLLAEANAAIRSGENTLKLIPLRGEWQTGLVRINTMMTGADIVQATFYLDGQPILTKRTPPYSVELDLGPVPRGRVLRVTGFDDQGGEITGDEITLNTGRHRFAVRLVEPRQGKTYAESVRAQAEVILPDDQIVERVEFYLNETLVATVYQPPYLQPIVLPENEEVTYVRAVAYTADGISTEDTVFVNFPGYVEDVDVDFVELYTAVLDKDRRPVGDLAEEEFSVFEDGVEQELVRFEQVRNLPIHVAAMLDVSASMEGRIEHSRGAALRFFEQTLTPKDRATVITFNDHPNLAAKFSNDVSSLAAGLAGLKAERGTALYDSLIFTLYYFNGIDGQRAILLLSDGKDESSEFDFDTALEYARRAGVAIYTIGLDLKGKDGDAKRKLSKLANETGGRSYFVDEAAELSAIYDQIQDELRSRYLLAYQSNNTTDGKAFRRVEVKVTRSGLEPKTMRGYYP